LTTATTEKGLRAQRALDCELACREYFSHWQHRSSKKYKFEFDFALLLRIHSIIRRVPQFSFIAELRPNCFITKFFIDSLRFENDVQVADYLHSNLSIRARVSFCTQSIFFYWQRDQYMQSSGANNGTYVPAKPIGLKCVPS